MWQKLISTQDSWAQVVLRLGLAAMMWPHGAQKLLGWFGGYGYSSTMAAMSEGFPSPIVFLVILGEFFGPILLLFGFMTRFAAASLAIIMIGAAKAHLPNGFFMNWFGSQAGEGIEFHILAIAIALALAIGGSGCASIDRVLSKKAE